MSNDAVPIPSAPVTATIPAPFAVASVPLAQPGPGWAIRVGPRTMLATFP